MHHKFCFNTTVSTELEELINYTMYKTYKFNNMGKLFKNGIINMKIIYRLFRYDPIGYKKNIYKFSDVFLPKNIKKTYTNSYSYKLNKNNYYLNLNNKKWCHPRYKNEVYNDSFIDLYDKALMMALNTIKQVNKVLYKNENIKTLDNVFLNISMTSGKNCNDKTKNKYFEF